MPSLAAAVRPFFDVNGTDHNLLRSAWDRLSVLPGGSRLFSHLVGRAAPYTATIDARVVELSVGRARVTMADRRAVRNHLHSVHAVALANLAELTGNVAVAYSLPGDARFIVAGMNLEYVKKARGAITGVCECDAPQSAARAEYDIPVKLVDGSGDTVVKATLRTLVGPKKSGKPRTTSS